MFRAVGFGDGLRATDFRRSRRSVGQRSGGVCTSGRFLSLGLRYGQQKPLCDLRLFVRFSLFHSTPCTTAHGILPPFVLQIVPEESRHPFRLPPDLTRPAFPRPAFSPQSVLPSTIFTLPTYTRQPAPTSNSPRAERSSLVCAPTTRRALAPPTSPPPSRPP